MAGAKKRLGRGLGNLISGGVTAKPVEREEPLKPEPVVEPSPDQEATSAVLLKEPQAQAEPIEDLEEEAIAYPMQNGRELYREIPMSKIEANPYQPRRTFDEEHIKELAESIRSEGLLQPIVVRPLPDRRYQLIAGERRWRAHGVLGLKMIAARIIDASDASSAVISMIENLQREGLNPIEESFGYASLMGDFDLTQEGVAERVGKGRATIANSLRLLQLDREVQGYLAKGMITAGHAKALLGLEELPQRTLLARRVVETGLSVREVERIVRNFKTEGMSKARNGSNGTDAENAVIRDLEKQISSRLNTKVQLKHSAKKGKIIIEYYGNEDLQRILESTGLQ